VYLEIPSLTKTEGRLEAWLDDWFRFAKHLGELLKYSCHLFKQPTKAHFSGRSGFSTQIEI
jgi:hypothetical protein